MHLPCTNTNVSVVHYCALATQKSCNAAPRRVQIGARKGSPCIAGNTFRRHRMRLTAPATVSALLLIAPALFAQSAAPNWVKVADKTAFTPRDSCGEMVYKDRMWLLGGWMDSFKDPPRDVWSSADGQEWTLATTEAAWKHADFPVT